MAAEQITTHPIASVLSHEPTQISLSSILLSIDLDNYENAKTKYRKPCYQRGLKKPTSWGEKLVESVLEGMSIGTFHISEWNIIKMVDGMPFVDSFFNIEDGQTRLNSLLEFKKGEFSTKYGCYNDSHIREVFDTYHVSVVKLSKKDTTVDDTAYFRQLNENFSRLQDGTQLTPSDRYWAWYESTSSGFAGSPLVNLTVALVNDVRFEDLFKNYMKIKNLQRRNNEERKHLADMIGLISGAWKGADYANSKYYGHVDIIQEEVSEEDVTRIESTLFHIQDIIREVLKEKPKYNGEQLGPLFKTTQKFTGAMMIHFEECGEDEYKKDVKIMWKTFINEYRKQKEGKVEKEWVNNIYITLSDGHKRNSSREDFKVRLDCVKKWYGELKQAAAAY